MVSKQYHLNLTIPLNHGRTTGLHSVDCYSGEINMMKHYKNSNRLWRFAKETEIADTYNIMGDVYCTLGEYNNALDVYEQSLSIREKELGIEQ